MAELVGLYPPGVVGDFQSLVKLEGGQGANENFKLITSKGAFLLKYCDEKDLKGLEAWLQTLRHLQAHSFPTGYMIPRSDGTFPVFTSDQRKVVLFQFLPGRSPSAASLTPKMMAALGKAMGRLHLVPLNPAVPAVDDGGCCMISELPLFLEDEVKGREEEHHPFVLLLKQKASQIHELLHRPSLPKAIIHTDLFPDNSLFEGEELVAVVDFEEVCTGPAILDLGMTLMSCCLKREEISGAIVLDEALALSFVEGYLTERSLEDEELSLLAEFLKLSCLIIGFWRFRNFNVKKREQSTPQDLEKYAEMTARIKKIEDWEREGGFRAFLQRLGRQSPQ